MNTETPEYHRPEPDRTGICEEADCTNTFEGGHGGYDRREGGKIVETTFICIPCSDKRKIVQFKEDGEISSDLLIHFVIDRVNIERAHKEANGGMITLNDLNLSLPYDVYEHIEAFQKSADLLITAFKVKHWMGGLCKQIDGSDSGVSGIGDNFKVMALASCGRALITIKDVQGGDNAKFGGATVTLIGLDGDITSGLGIQGICATRDEAIGLLWHAVYRMPELTPDKKVSLGF